MADPPPWPDTKPHIGDDTTTPRWVKVFGIIVGVVILLFVILLVTRGPGDHGPGRHISGGDTPPSSVTEHAPGGRTPPEGGHG